MLKRRRGYLLSRDDVSNPAARQLESEGWALLPGAFTRDEVAALKAAVLHVFETVPADGRGPDPRAWPMFRYEMLNRSAECQRAVGQRAVLDAIEPLLGEDCHVIANTAWRNPPTSDGLHGGGHWHIDAGPHVPLPDGVEWPREIPHPVFAIGAHIYLEPCAVADGPTGVIPGSHLSGKPPPADRLLDDELTWNGRGVEPLLAAPGDVGLFVSDVWHRRLPTRAGDRGRLFLQVHYGRRDIAQRLRPSAEINQLTDAAIERATDERERTLAGLHPRFFYDG
ncbi:MAG: phytanoyl-CoA dioxygenase family protein [Pseudomonadota bacterium]